MSDGHAAASAQFLRSPERAAWHDQALWYVRAKRDRMASSRADWELLRDRASEVKLATLSGLESFLLQFEARAIANGAHVHWARDGESCNRTVLRLFAERSVRSVVKSKSMLTEECGLNRALEGAGIDVIDTDLGERIVQLRKEHPSHIVLPAIHLKKEEVGELFHRELETPAGVSDPARLTGYAREHLRETYRHAQAAVSGANFLIAETGTVVVCTNEGNFDLGVSCAPLHIVCVGIEKVIPTLADLPVFLRLLARSATGQPITVYTTHVTAPRPGGELHVVLVDNGRAAQRAHPILARSLACIRCGACMNTCPVYRRSGGASYGYTIPGPIGSVLAPFRDDTLHRGLPYASSLCGSCTAVCPVKIPLHEQLLAWRGELVRRGRMPRMKRIGFWMGARVLGSARLYSAFGFCARRIARILPRWVVYHRANIWGRERELPDLPDESFRGWYARRKRELGRSPRPGER